MAKNDNSTLWWILGAAGAAGLYLALSGRASAGDVYWDNILAQARDLEDSWKAGRFTQSEAIALATKLESDAIRNNPDRGSWAPTEIANELTNIFDRIRSGQR